MQAKIYINRAIVRKNKKQSQESGKLVDEPAIAINTYRGSVYVKSVQLPPNAVLRQDASNAQCSGATIWIECLFEELILDGKPAHRSMLPR